MGVKLQQRWMLKNIQKGQHLFCKRTIKKEIKFPIQYKYC